MRRLAACLFCLTLAGAPAVAAPANLALGKKVTFLPKPNYRLTVKGESDATDLTDGKLSSRRDAKLWFDAKAVGWSYGGLAQLTLDLGREANVGEVAIRLQAGSPSAGICMPCWVDLVASTDGRRFFRVASYSRWTPGDDVKFAIPRDKGQALVHKLRFQNVNVRARHIGLSFYGTSLNVADEMAVLAGRAGATYRPPSEGELTDFSVTAPRMYFHKPVVTVSTNINTPTPIGLLVPRAFVKKRLTAVLELPKGVRLVGGTVGGEPALERKPAPSPEPGRHTFTFAASKSNKAWSRIYLRSDWPDGRGGAMRCQLKWPGGQTPMASVPIRAMVVKPAPQPKRLLTGLGWWSLGATRAWPEALEAFRTLGFNTLPLFARWAKLDEKENMAAVDRFREAGFKVVNVDSPFHHMLNYAGKQKPTLLCQLAGGSTGKRFCPSYRGPLYRKEIERLARQSVQAKASFVTCDIELWNWRGPVDSPKCTRCKADFAKSGLKDWKAWRLAKGEEIWKDLAAAVFKAAKEAGLERPDIGGYDFRAGRDYQFFWPFDRLYPKHMQSSQVSTYTPYLAYHLGLIGDEVRADRQKLPKSDVLPWLTPGDSGVFPGEMFTYALLECFANGARGTYFWSGRVWDAETLAAYADAIRIAVPVEDVIVDGQLAKGVFCRPRMRVSGMRRANELFLLVADYHTRKPRTVTVTLPTPGPAAVVDLASGEEVATLPAGKRAFKLRFDKELAKALHVRPK